MRHFHLFFIVLYLDLVGFFFFFFNTEHLWLLSLNILLNNDALEA